MRGAQEILLKEDLSKETLLQLIHAAPSHREAGQILNFEHQCRRTHDRVETVGRLAGDLAHSFNNLLATIIGYGQMLIDKFDDNPEVRGQLQKILESGGRAARITRQLLTLSTKREGETKVVDPNAVIQKLLNALRAVLSDKVSIDLNLTEECKRIKVDERELEQILMHLVINAEEAMPEGGILTLSTRNEVSRESGELESAVIIDISDTGEGMSPLVKEVAFEPFFSTKLDKNERGVGMVAVRKMLDHAEGKINVESLPGKGTKVSVCFPRFGRTAGFGRSCLRE